MNAATTITGAYGSVVDFFDLDNSVIKLQDITERLSRIVRFNGGTINPYTVGQHTLVLDDIAVSENKSNNTRLLILLHDATEAFMGDLVSPLKAVLPEFSKLEDKLFDAICKQIAPNTTFTLEDKIYCKSIDYGIRYAEWFVLNNNKLIDPAGAWSAIYGADTTVQPNVEKLIRTYYAMPRSVINSLLKHRIKELSNGE